jgi:hypothetical protein
LHFNFCACNGYWKSALFTFTENGESLELGRVTLRIAQEEILAEGKFIAEQVVQVPSGTTSEQVGSMIVKIRNQFGIQEVSLFTPFLSNVMNCS